MKSVRLAIVNAPTPDGSVFMKELGRCGRRSAGGERWPQTGLAHLAAVGRTAGCEVLLYDPMAEAVPFHAAARHISSWQPDLTLLHASTPTFVGDARFAAALKELNAGLVALIGYHPTVMPQACVDQSVADFVFVGEVEVPLMDLLARMNAGAKRDELVEPAIHGILWRGQTLPPAMLEPRLVDNLDQLPLPVRDGLPLRRYVMPFFGREPFTTVIPTRGCPYKCTFCRAGAVWGETTRARSVPHIMEEILALRRNAGIRNVVFMTDTFTVNRKWVRDLCAAIRKDAPDLRWMCNSRVDLVERDLLSEMARSGCKLISYGIESGDPDILASTRKNITLQQAEEAIRVSKEAGITFFAYFIVGLPGENWDTIRRTIDFAVRTDPDYALFHIATPFPGTTLFEQAAERGLILNQDWTTYDEEKGGAMRTEYLSAEEIVRARKLAMRRFYFRPSRVLRELGRIRSLSDLRSRLTAGLHILASS